MMVGGELCYSVDYGRVARLQYDDGREAAAVPMAEDATEVSMAWTGG